MYKIHGPTVRLLLMVSLMGALGACNPTAAQQPAAIAVVAEQQAATGRPARAWIGINVGPISDKQRGELDLPNGQGLVIEGVSPQSPAAKAGLQPHDVIFSAGEKAIGDVHDLVDAVQGAADRELKLQVFRKGKPITVTVRPTREPFAGWFTLFGEGANVRPVLPGAPMPQGPQADWLRLPQALAQPSPLPEGMQISVSRTGTGPVAITVKQGDKTWETTLDRLNELPADVRGHVQSFLRSLAWQSAVSTFQLPHAGEARPTPSARPGEPFQPLPPGVVPHTAPPREGSVVPRAATPSVSPNPRPMVDHDALRQHLDPLLKDRLAPLGNLSEQMERLRQRIDELERRLSQSSVTPGKSATSNSDAPVEKPPESKPQSPKKKKPKTDK